MDQERAVLLDFLDGERSHVLGILEGLSEEQLRRSVLPSGWSCLGMVKHRAWPRPSSTCTGTRSSAPTRSSLPCPGHGPPPDPRMGEWRKRFTSLRVVMLHMLKETAVHAGHLDVAAELLDGRQWIVMSLNVQFHYIARAAHGGRTGPSRSGRRK
jgi:Protein of unknown function (DUF664)